MDYGDEPRPDWWITWTRSWFQWWISAPSTFDTVAQDTEDVGSRTRRALRDRINKTKLLERCVQDIKTLLAAGIDPGNADDDRYDRDNVMVQSDRTTVAGGRNYAEDVAW